MTAKIPAIICDLDGTLCLFPGKNPYDRDFSQDIVNEPVRRIIDKFILTHAVLLTSGRDGKFKDITNSWLIKNQVVFDMLLMRPAGDRRPDVEIKKEIFFRDIEPFYDVLFCLDDRDRVVALWRELGLVCLQVAPGSF